MRMQIDRISFCVAVFQLSTWMIFDGGNNGLIGVNGKYEWKADEVGEGFLNDTPLNCSMKGKSDEKYDAYDNPDECWAFRTQLYDNPKNLNCCHTTEKDDDVPELLKDIVKIESDGM